MFVKTLNATFIKLAYVCGGQQLAYYYYSVHCASLVWGESTIIFKYRPCKSLLTPVLENIPKWMYRNGTYNVRSVYQSCTSICTEVVIPKWSAPCTEMVMYRTGPTPKQRINVFFIMYYLNYNQNDNVTMSIYAQLSLASK